MSTTILTAVRTHLDADNRLTGLNVRFNRWSDEIENGAGGFILMRMGGGFGPTNRLVKSPDVRLLIVCDATEVATEQDRIWSMADYLREPGAPAGVIKFAVLGNPVGPMYMENGRGVFELNVRVFV